MAALHEPDMAARVSGGNPSRMGDRGINCSIGASWNQEGRLETLDDFAKQHANSGNGSAKMNVELELCRGNGLRLGEYNA